jgi:hypothetical protein
MELLPYTGYYITMLVISIILDAICPFLHIYWYFAFSFKQIFENFQLWRIFTNYLVKPTKRLNVGIIFDIIYLYSHIYKLELEAKYSRQYSKFIFTLFLLVILNILTTFAIYIIFSATESRSLINELIYSFMAISSYKNPNDKTIVFYIPVKNRYVPIATIFFNVSSNTQGDLTGVKKSIIGFISGYVYCFLVEKLKINYVPNFLKKLLGEKVNEYERKIFKEKNKEKKEKNNFMNIKSNDSTNVAFRKKESVIDGNEFSEFNKNDIKWD